MARMESLGMRLTLVFPAIKVDRQDYVAWTRCSHLIMV